MMMDSNLEAYPVHSVIPMSEWMPVKFSDIRPGDWLRITHSELGVVTVRQGVVHRKEAGRWLTVDGGQVASEKDKDIIRAPRRKRGWNLLTNVSSLATRTRDFAKDLSTSSIPKVSRNRPETDSKSV